MFHCLTEDLFPPQDPYFMKNHLGSYECKLCLTLHNNEVRSLGSALLGLAQLSDLPPLNPVLLLPD
jgi:hypothetical protein